MVSEIEDHRLQLGVRAALRALKTALDLLDVNFKSVPLPRGRLRQQNRTINGALR